jgi:hypothetical protein
MPQSEDKPGWTTLSRSRHIANRSFGGIFFTQYSQQLIMARNVNNIIKSLPAIRSRKIKSVGQG